MMTPRKHLSLFKALSVCFTAFFCLIYGAHAIAEANKLEQKVICSKQDDVYEKGSKLNLKSISHNILEKITHNNEGDSDLEKEIVAEERFQSTLKRAYQTPYTMINSDIGIAVYPQNGAKYVSINDAIAFRFICSHSKLVVNEIKVTNKKSIVVGKAHFYKDIFLYEPSIPLRYNVKYTVTVSGSILKKKGEKLALFNIKWHFYSINPKSKSIILYNDFNQYDLGKLNEPTILSDWNAFSSEGVKEGRVSIENGRRVGEKVLCIHYEPHQHGLKSGGTHWRTKIQGRDELYFSFWIKFDQSFDFVRGGKLPGLAGGTANTGGNKPNGRDGWSSRIMWRDQGKIVQYVYHPDQKDKFGKDFVWDIEGETYFEPGLWYRVETWIKLNSPGKNNGIVESWLDGKLALKNKKMRFRDIKSLKIDALLFTTFFGGSDDTWATKKAEHVCFDNVIISTRPIFKQ